MIDITGLDKRDVLAVLYNSSRPQGLGFLNYDANEMTREQAGELLAKTTYFDYLQGRVMKVDLKSDESFDPWLYDRDNGQGAAQAAVDRLRKGDSEGTAKQHREGVHQAAALTHNELHRETRHTTDGDVEVVTLGLSDVKDKLKPKIDEAKQANP